MEKVYRCPIRIGDLALTLCCVAMLGTAGLAATPGPMQAIHSTARFHPPITVLTTMPLRLG